MRSVSGARTTARWAVVLVLFAACADDGSGNGGEPTSIATDLISAGSSTVRVQDTLHESSLSPATTDSPTTAVPPEPTGVPGLDDADPFCASWAVYSGTLQAIGIADAFGGLSSRDVARLEMFAAAALTESVGGIGSRWPAELVGERAIVLSDLVGPYTRRAEKALIALRDAGVTDDEMSELREAWMAALRTRDHEQPVIAVVPPRDELDDKVSTAAAAYDDAVTPFADDPSLIVDAIVSPLTDHYLSAHCPDLASSGVGDAV